MTMPIVREVAMRNNEDTTVPFENDTNSIDVYVGKRVRERRQRLGWTLMDLAERLGVSHQQVQKYEHGTTRISCAVLYQLSHIFQTNQNYFFTGLEEDPHISEGLGRTHTDTLRLTTSDPLHIILVEDDAGDELLTRKAIEATGLSVDLHTLHDGESALQFLRRGEGDHIFPRPDLIFLDLNLPRRDGHSLLKDLKRDRSLMDIPVVVLTNRLSRTDMMACYRAGASGYLCKSFDFDIFKSNIQRLVQYWWHTALLPNRN